MDQPRICPVCRFENKSNARVCARCQAPLVSVLPTRITERVPEPSINVPGGRRKYLGHLPPNVIGLQVSTREEPFLIQVETELLLGRDNQTGVPPLFDLTPYGGMLLGVSRQHALISRTEAGYAVKDLGSTNGCWLNGTRLKSHQFYDLGNGDQLRLAQLTLYVYVASEQRIVENRFCLRGGTADLAMTPDHLVSNIGPYLRTIAGLQAVIDDLMERKSAGAFVLSISTETAAICVKMTGITEALDMIETTVSEWRRKYRGANTTRHIPVDNLGDPGETTESVAVEEQSILPEQDQLLTDLANAIIKQLAPALDPAAPDTKAYVTRLLPPLRVLVFSPLSITYQRQYGSL